MDILDPTKWVPLIQAAVTELLTPFEQMAQRLISFFFDRLESQTIPLIKAELLGLTVTTTVSQSQAEKDKS